MKLFKNRHYKINGRIGQYELTTLKNEICFYMEDTLKYEYFDSPKIEKVNHETSSRKDF